MARAGKGKVKLKPELRANKGAEILECKGTPLDEGGEETILKVINSSKK